MSYEKKKLDIEIIYKISGNSESKVKIFGKDFINNNKNKCKIIYKNQE